MKKSNGFTLAELLAVIVILALVLVIAIPSVLNSAQKAKKENFYLYAQSLNSKATAIYNEDIKENPEHIDCVVYDIGKDLDISDTGDYEGWVKISRIPINSGKRSVIIELNSPVAISNAKYCIGTGSQCTPDTSLTVKEGDTSIKVNKTVKENEVMCATYQYPSNGVLVSSDTVCRSYNEGTEVIDTYEYDVRVTLTDKTYVIQDYQIIDAEKGNKKAMFATLDANKNNPPLKDSDNPTKISSPVCNSTDTITYKGLKENKTTIITTTTTTINQADNTTLLSELYIDNYDFGFNPQKFNYNINVSNDVTSVNVKYKTMDDNAEVVISGNKDLSVGKNNVTIEVKNTATGKSQKYIVVINRLAVGEVNEPSPTKPTKPAVGEVDEPSSTEPTKPIDTPSGIPDPSLEESNALLQTLMVSGYVINFDPRTFNYTLEIKDEEKLNVSYRAQAKNAVVVVTGADNITNGSKIEIYVQSQNGYYKNTYTIEVKRNVSTSILTKVLRIIAIGLVALLIVILLILYISRRRRVRITKKENINDIISSDMSNNN